MQHRADGDPVGTQFTVCASNVPACVITTAAMKSNSIAAKACRIVLDCVLNENIFFSSCRIFQLPSTAPECLLHSDLAYADGVGSLSNSDHYVDSGRCILRDRDRQGAAAFAIRGCRTKQL